MKQSRKKKKVSKRYKPNSLKKMQLLRKTKKSSSKAQQQTRIARQRYLNVTKLLEKETRELLNSLKETTAAATAIFSESKTSQLELLFDA
jgi:hypothetical protein